MGGDTTSPPGPAVPGRVAGLDGLRGLVIASVVLNHAGGALWPRGAVYDVPGINGFLGGGAVVVFFVVGAFIVTRGLIRDLERGTFDPLRFYLRRVVRLGVQLVPLCAAVWLAARAVGDRVTDTVMAHNVLHVLTFTFNRYTEAHLLEARPELGHLWYLSVQQQCYLVLPIVLLLFLRARRLLVVVLLLLIGLVVWNRQQVLDSSGWVVASALTTTRADGLLWGVALAVALPWLARVRGWRHLQWLSGMVLVGLMTALPYLGRFAFLGPWSVAFMLVSGVLVVAIWHVENGTRVSRWLSWRPFERLGKSSLTIFIWHLPVIVVLTQQTPGWVWPARTLLALAILAVIVVAMERLAEEPVRRLLATHPVFRVPPALDDERTAAERTRRGVSLS